MDYRGQTAIKNVFMTGATGVLGARLLVEILTSTEAMVYCLCRGTTYETALSRIRDVADVYSEGHNLEAEFWRVIPVLGNLADVQLGIDSEVYDELAESMDLVFHCAANVSLLASYEKLKPVNVDGVERIIDFCLVNGTPLVYVSSFSVIGDKLFHDFTLHENQLDVEQGFEELNYEKSKFDAEKRIHQASSRGLSWAIVRPGNIWGDSKSGAYPIFETKVKGIYYDIVKTLVETGYTYLSEEDFDVTPVDYVSEATLFIGLNIHKTQYQTYHLTCPNPINFNQLVDAIREYGYTIRDVDGEEYFTALHEDRIIRNGEVYRSNFTDLLAIFVDDDELEELGKWDTTQIQQLLKDTPITIPEFDQRLMTTLLDYSVRRQWLPSVDNQGPLAEISEEMGSKVFMEHLYDGDEIEVV